MSATVSFIPSFHGMSMERWKLDWNGNFIPFHPYV